MNSMFGKYLSLLDSLLVTAICMVIVFLVLIIIAYILSLFEHIPKNLSNTHTKNIGQETFHIIKQITLLFMMIIQSLLTQFLMSNTLYMNQKKTELKLKL